MANVSYNSGVPDVLPETQTPNDLSNVQPTAAEGLGELGAGAMRAAQFYDSAAADNAFNDYQSKAVKLLYGDPSKTGPDGSPDLGFMGLQGRAAMDARPQMESQLDALQKDAVGSLNNDVQRQQFETYSRRYRNSAAVDIGSHTDQQSNAWYRQVNADTEKNALDAISTNPLDGKTVANAAADLTNARVKSAVLNGARPVPGDPQYDEAISSSKKDAFKAQVLSVSATDPTRAMRILQKSPDLAGTDYPQLYDRVRTASIDATSDGIAQQQFSDYTVANGSPVRPAGGTPGQPAWMDTYLQNVRSTESGGSATAQNPNSSATGQYQFIAKTWNGLMQNHPELGLTADGRTDPAQQQRAAQALTADNANVLTQNRVPITPGNLYMAHVFGPQSAAGLYDMPANTPMEQAVSADVLKANGWMQGKSVGEVRQWAANRAGAGIDTSAGGTGASMVPAVAPLTSQPGPASAPGVDASIAAPVPAMPPAATAGTVPMGMQSAKASMVQAVLDMPAPDGVTPRDWSDIQSKSITKIAQRLQYEQIAADQTAAQKKATNDQAMGGYVQKMLTPGSDLTGMQAAIAADPNLEPETKVALVNTLTSHADRTVAGATAAYGDGYWDTYKRILLPAGDPNRVVDTTDLLKMAAPGPNGEQPKLTLDGVTKLQQELGAVTKSPDAAAVATTKAGLLNYAKSKLSFQQDTGPVQIKDPKGEALFNSQFIPQFEKAYADSVTSGKESAFDFLTQGTVDKMLQGIRNPHEMAMEKLQAMQGINAEDIPTAPAPDGVDQDAWKLVLTSPPTMEDGKASPLDKWTQAITMLQQQPTPERMALFDNFFGQKGVRAQDVLDVLGIKSRPMTSEEKAAAAPKAPEPQPPASAPPLGLGPESRQQVLDQFGAVY